MPTVPILMPQLGESIAEATIVRLLAAVGDTVHPDQEIIEVETNKAVMSITTLCHGTVADLRAKEGVSYPVGTMLGLLEVTVEEVARTGVDTLECAAAASEQTGQVGRGDADQAAAPHFAVDGDCYEETSVIEPTIKGLPVPVGTLGAHYISPRMRARMNDLGLQEADISAVVGTGAGGRVTVEDLDAFLEYLSDWPSSKASSMRLAVADAMRRSWTRPLATVGLPVHLDRLINFRRETAPAPTFTLFLLRAFALALAETPATVGYLIGKKVVHPRAFDIGVAVQVPDGVLVPVLRRADQRSVAELAPEYADLVERARKRTLTPDDCRGGVATFTNFGSFGLTLGTPIPLPNETLILGMGAAVKKPVWSEQVGAFIPATEAALALTFDHRVVDGGGAGELLNRVAALLQKPEAL